MSSPVAALLVILIPSLAWAQQQGPQPDTGPARERHRKAMQEPPKDDGPWGPEEAGLTWQNPVWRGAFLDVESYSAMNLDLHTPRGSVGQSDGVGTSFVETLDWKAEQFRTIGGRLMFDLDMMRLSATYLTGSFEGTAILNSTDPTRPLTNLPVALHGSVSGMRFGAYWPAFRYRDAVLEASLGPNLTVGWLHEEVSSVPQASLPFRDAKDILTGTLGPEVSIRAMFGRYSFELDGEYSFITGSARGWTRALLAGIGYHF